MLFIFSLFYYLNVMCLLSGHMWRQRSLWEKRKRTFCFVNQLLIYMCASFGTVPHQILSLESHKLVFYYVKFICSFYMSWHSTQRYTRFLVGLKVGGFWIWLWIIWLDI